MIHLQRTDVVISEPSILVGRRLLCNRKGRSGEQMESAGCAPPIPKDFESPPFQEVLYCLHLVTRGLRMSTTAIFRNLQRQPGQPLVLENIWDAGSARLVESLGCQGDRHDQRWRGLVTGLPRRESAPLRKAHACRPRHRRCSQMLWGHLAKLSRRFLTEGDSRIFTRDSMSYGQLQALFGASR